MRPSKSFLALFALLLLACTTGATAAPEHHHPASPSAEHDERRSIAVQVGASGYSPGEVTAAAGEEVRIVFTRTSDEGCGQQLVFPDLDIRRDLPLDEAVPVDITMPASGTIAFTCGMGMYRGAVVVR